MLRKLCQRSTPAVLALLVSACAAASGTRQPQLAPLGDPEIDEVAALVRLEDRREFDSTTFARVAAAPHPELRRRSALALGRIRNGRGRHLLLNLLADPDSSVSATAAFSLGQVGDTTVLPALASRLSAPTSPPTLVAEAAAALGKLGTHRARDTLASFLNNARADDRSRPAVGEALLAIPRTPRGDLAPVIRWTGSADPELRWRAAYALSRRADPAAMAVLLQLAADPDARVRAFALRGLTAALADSAGIGAAQAAAVLRQAVSDSDRAVQANALRALGTHRDSATVALLARHVGHPDAWLRVSAAESLRRLGAEAGAAAPALASAASTAGPAALRSAALLALSSVAPSQAVAVAATFARAPDWRPRVAAARAYATTGPAARPELAALFRDPDSRVAAAALASAVDAAGDSLAQLRSQLIGALASDDVGVRSAALSGLAKLGEPATLPLLVDAYARAQSDKENDAALAAVDAIGALQRRAGIGANAFFARFPRSRDALIRDRAAREFGRVAEEAWGTPHPVETGRSDADYRSLVERWIMRAPQGSQPRARIITDSGTIELELFAADAPLTVDNFARLAGSHFFDGQEWPRVVANFVVQGGDPKGDTSGGPGYAIRDEINRNRYTRGTLGMALSGPDTGGSQWFITHSAQPHLDGGYTVFGRVLSGIEVVDKIAVGDRIQRIEVVP